MYSHCLFLLLNIDVHDVCEVHPLPVPDQLPLRPQLEAAHVARVAQREVLDLHVPDRVDPLRRGERAQLAREVAAVGAGEQVRGRPHPRGDVGVAVS